MQAELGEYKMPVGRDSGLIATTPTHRHLVLSPVSLGSRDQDGGP